MPITDVLWVLFCQLLSYHRVVRDKERVAADAGEVREGGIGDSDTIVSTGTTAESDDGSAMTISPAHEPICSLVQDDQGARSQSPKNIAGLGQLDHECRFASADIVRRTHPPAISALLNPGSMRSERWTAYV